MKRGTELPCWSHNASVQHMLENHCKAETGTSTACTEKARKEGKGLPICRAQLLDATLVQDVLGWAATPAPKAWLASRVPPNPASHMAQQAGRDSPHPARAACRAELLPKMPCASLVPILLPGIQPPCSRSRSLAVGWEGQREVTKGKDPKGAPGPASASGRISSNPTRSHPMADGICCRLFVLE